PLGGISSLTTSAPRSARIRPRVGPAIYCVMSKTRTPVRFWGRTSDILASIARFKSPYLTTLSYASRARKRATSSSPFLGPIMRIGGISGMRLRKFARSGLYRRTGGLPHESVFRQGEDGLLGKAERAGLTWFLPSSSGWPHDGSFLWGLFSFLK